MSACLFLVLRSKILGVWPAHIIFEPMKNLRLASICFAVIFAFIGCEEQWGNDAHMGYVSGIDDNGNGSCTYYLSKTRNGTDHANTIVSPCGHWKVGEGIFVPQ